MEEYKGWKLFNKLPDGWKIDKTAGSPLNGYEFCTNGKSVINGQKRGLVKIEPKDEVITHKPVVVKKEPTDIKEPSPFPSEVVNLLARKKFEEQILKEIRFDLIICDIEGWDKTEYIKELQSLINSIDINKH